MFIIFIFLMLYSPTILNCILQMQSCTNLDLVDKKLTPLLSGGIIIILSLQHYKKIIK